MAKASTRGFVPGNGRWTTIFLVMAGADLMPDGGLQFTACSTVTADAVGQMHEQKRKPLILRRWIFIIPSDRQKTKVNLGLA